MKQEWQVGLAGKSLLGMRKFRGGPLLQKGESMHAAGFSWAWSGIPPRAKLHQEAGGIHPLIIFEGLAGSKDFSRMNEQ